MFELRCFLLSMMLSLLSMSTSAVHIRPQTHVRKPNAFSYCGRIYARGGARCEGLRGPRGQGRHRHGRCAISRSQEARRVVRRPAHKRGRCVCTVRLVLLPSTNGSHRISYTGSAGSSIWLQALYNATSLRVFFCALGVDLLCRLAVAVQTNLP